MKMILKKPGGLSVLLLLCIFAFQPGSALAADPKSYKKKSAEGYGNCIFAGKEVVKGGESTVSIKDTFTGPEPVFARCYFPGPIGRVEASDFWHEIWINGQIKKRTLFHEAPGSNWDQIQIWVTENDYTPEMKALKRGKHEVVIWVMKNARTESGKVKWAPARLSRGEFIYIVP